MGELDLIDLVHYPRASAGGALSTAIAMNALGFSPQETVEELICRCLTLPMTHSTFTVPLFWKVKDLITITIWTFLHF